jgi:hypothetical protein
MISRRQFLASGAAGLGWATLSPSPSSWAAAVSGTAPELGLNLSGMSYWAAEQPFSNLAYNAARWRVQVKDAPFTWDEPLPPLTTDGYPLSVPPNAFLDSFLVFTPYRAHLPAEIFLHYEGTGRMTYVGGGELLAQKPGLDTVKNLRRGDALTLRMIETSSTDPIRNIRLFESQTPPVSLFREPFLRRLEGMSVLRFMDWMATNNSPVVRWEDRPRPASFGRSEAGVALEEMIALCNETRIAPWFNMPHMADDDYVRAFAKQVLRDLDPALPVHVEYSNEVWNTIFDQANYAGQKGLSQDFSEDGYEAQLRFYAHRSTQIIRIWKGIFGAQAARVKGVYAAQADNSWTSETILDFEDAYRTADILAIAPYFGGSFGSPERASETQTWSLDRLFDELKQDVEIRGREQIRAQVALARRYGVVLYAYEGGQHLVGHGGAENNETLTELFIAANRDPRMGDLYKRHLQIWEEEGGGIYALFSSMGEPSKWGSWGLLEYEGDRRPKWDAVQQILRG